MASRDHISLPDPPPRGRREQDRDDAPPSADRSVAGESVTGESAKKRICVARIGAAHGIRGEVRVWSFTADPFALADYGPLESADGTQSFAVETLRSGKTGLIARLSGVSDRAAAEKLANIELFVPRHRLPQLEEASEFYHADLIGLAVVSGEGGALGRVVAVQNFGAGDLIEIEPLVGSVTVLLPFTETMVPVVDLAAGRVVVNPPEGLFEPPPPPADATGAR